jgi:competence ComEA-like helix-hairpin-helix protein
MEGEVRLPDFLQFTPEERRAALALLLFTGGGGLLLEIGRRNPEWAPDLLSATSGSRVIQPADSTRVAASMLAPLTPGLVRDPGARLSDSTEAPSPGHPPADSAAGESRASKVRPGAARVKKAPSGPVDLDTADAATLMTLPGIGPALAARIVQDRERNGPFRSVDDLARVKGIGQKTLARLKPFLVAGTR